jgi:hypothetical protein
MWKQCWIVIGCVLMLAAFAGAQSGTPSINPNPPAQRAENPAPPQIAKNAQLITVSGLVSDSFCVRHHYMLSHATDAECVRYCIAHNANYVVLAGDKAYNLQDDPGHVLTSLANRQVSVTGWLVDPTHIEIKSVKPIGKTGQ